MYTVTGARACGSLVGQEHGIDIGSPRTHTQWLIALAILLTAFNLRTAVTSVGPLIEELANNVGMTGTLAGLLTALPVLTFAGVGAASPRLARRVGEQRLLMASMVVMAAGLAGRALAHDAGVFLVGSTVALAGGAVGNVVIPSQVKRHFPTRIGPMTAMYTAVLAIGQSLAAALTVPVASAAGGDNWRLGLGIWAAVAAVAVLPWLPLVRGQDTVSRGMPAAVNVRQLARSPLAWALLVMFGTQSTQAYVAFGWFAQFYRDHGMTAQQAGVVIAAISGIGIPISLVVPTLAARIHDHRVLLVGVTACCSLAYVGMLVAGNRGVWLWAFLLGVGFSMFPLVLVLLGLRTHRYETTAALSAFVQGGGYVLAAVGPLLVGALYEITGGWTGPMIFLLLVTVGEGVACLIGGRPRFIEDELHAPQVAHP